MAPRFDYFVVVALLALLFSVISPSPSSAAAAGASGDEILSRNLAVSVARRALESPDSLVGSSKEDDKKEDQNNNLRPLSVGGGSLFLRAGAMLQEQLLQQQQQQQQPEAIGGDPSAAAGRSRSLGDAGGSSTCDVAFLNCITVEACASCFLEMETQDINWAGVTETTPCTEVVGFLSDENHCTALKGDQKATDTFCSTFKTCVVWFDDDDDEDPDGSDDDDANDDDSSGSGGGDVDCSKLTECNWEGMHPSFIGNGVCNDGMGGCYNTKICNYDGGDCCEDTCKNDGSSWVECGHDGYKCKDPDSTSCDPSLTTGCDPSKTTKKDDGKIDPAKTVCKDDEVKYRIVMYDSFGDGWDSTTLSIKPKSSSVEAYSGKLKTGSQGTDYVCLNKNPTCYHVDVKGGVWGNEISWEVKPMTEGAPAIAGGGSPMDCNFAVAGGKCGDDDDLSKTCSGKPNIQPSDDPGYKELKDLFQCVEEKCLIQVGACHKDEVCDGCFHADPEDYCYANDAFTAIADCTLCQCTDTQKSDFCNKKVSPGSILPPVTPPGDGSQSQKVPCTPAETISGGSSVINFSKCVNYEQVAMMVTDFDQNNFGDLDKFESCAHSFTTADHGGHTALGCLQILVNAMNGASSVENKDKTPVEAIKALALSLYKDASNFCDCAKTASDKCPLCPSFFNFKTLLYESLDACKSLDEIDCDAWKEFYPPCKTNMADKFGTVDFNKEEQCNYIRENCGGVGPFPAFRRLDCDKELATEAWSFYQDYSKSCLKDEPIPPPKPAPAPTPSDSTPSDSTPSVPVPAPTPKPTPKPYVPPDSGSGGSKPYVPPEEKDKPAPAPYVPPDSSSSKSSSSSSSTYTPPEQRKGGKFFWLFIWVGVAGIGYIYFKKRTDGFNFIRYRRMRNNFRDDSDMYSGLALESSTNFEPPHLPPTPAAMGGIQ